MKFMGLENLREEKMKRITCFVIVFVLLQGGSLFAQGN